MESRTRSEFPPVFFQVLGAKGDLLINHPLLVIHFLEKDFIVQQVGQLLDP